MPSTVSAAEATWVFGHGSVIFDPRLPYRRAEVVRVRGWSRRMGQPSVRNWGRPSHPAPTSCLVEGGSVAGVAYGIAGVDADRAMRAMVDREALPPVPCEIQIDGERVEAWTWPMRSTWADQSVDELVDAARRNVISGGGPHGDALDYATGLCDALSRLDCEDRFVSHYTASLRTALVGPGTVG